MRCISELIAVNHPSAVALVRVAKSSLSQPDSRTVAKTGAGAASKSACAVVR